MISRTLKFIISVSIFTSSLVFANDFVIKNVKNATFQQSDFPFFFSKTYPQSATNINELIQYDFFEKVYKESDFSDSKRSPFSGKTHKRSAYIYGFDVNKNENYITLSINAEGCGAYCEGYTIDYIFDVYTGRVISLIDLLSPAGSKQLEKTIRAMNKSKIKAYIKDKPTAANKALTEADEYEIEQYEMYKDCYNSRFVKYPDSYYKVNELTSFSLENNTLSTTFGRCSNHALRALDEIDDFVNKFTFKELESYLTPDAKMYLSNKPHRLAKLKTPYQIYHGKIANKYPITMIRQKHLGWVYWYNKYKTPIDLHSVKIKQNNTYVLQEGHHNGINKWIYTSEFRLTQKGNTLIGVFVNLKSGKEMVVELK